MRELHIDESEGFFHHLRRSLDVQIQFTIRDLHGFRSGFSKVKGPVARPSIFHPHCDWGT